MPKKPTKKPAVKKKQEEKLSKTQKLKRFLTKRPFGPHRSFRFSRKKDYTTTPKLKFNSGWSTGKQVLGVIQRWPKKFLAFGGIYMLAYGVLIGGTSQPSYVSLKESLSQAADGRLNEAMQVGSLFTLTLSGSISQPLTELQTFMAATLVLLFWLVIVWSLRFLLAGEAFRLRDAFYSAPAPLIPSLMLMLVVTLQLVPAALGIFGFAIASSVLLGGVEIMLFAVAAILLLIISFYWMTSSTVALVIVTLPRMYPMRALRAARELVTGQRVRVFVNIAWLGLWIVAISAIVLLPVLLVDKLLNQAWLPLVPITVQALAAFHLIFSATYLYKLYRQLL